MIKAIIQKKRYLFFLKGRISNFSDESIFLTSPINFNLFSIRRIFIFMTAYKDRKKNIAIFKEILDNWNFNYVQVEGEKEVKALDSTFLTIEKLTKKGRVVIPPRIDFALLYSEGWFSGPKVDPKLAKIYFPMFVLEREGEKYSAFLARDYIGLVYYILDNGIMFEMNVLDSKNYKTLELYYATGAKLNYDLFAKRSKDESMFYIICKEILGEDYIIEHSIVDWVKALNRKCVHEPYHKAHERIELEEKDLDELMKHKAIDEVNLDDIKRNS